MPDENPSAVTDRRFGAIVAALGHDDPRFVRRLAAPRAGHLTAGNLMIAIGLLLTVALGAVPLAVGLHLQVTALLAVGAVGCVVLPVLAPLVVRTVVRRVRPLWV